MILKAGVSESTVLIWKIHILGIEDEHFAGLRLDPHRCRMDVGHLEFGHI